MNSSLSSQQPAHALVGRSETYADAPVVRGGCILFHQRISHRVLGAANGILELAFELVRIAVRLKFGIARRVAD